jgi:hypothetical protein
MTRTSEIAVVCCVVMAAASAHAAGPSAADQVNARKLFNQGLDLRDAGKVEEALAKLEAADALVPTPKTRLELGRTHQMLGHLLDAYQAFLSAKGLPVEPTSESKYATARAEAAKLAAELEPKLAQIELVVTDGADVDVDVDGHRVAAAALKEPRIVGPGLHEIVASYRGHAPTRLTVTLVEGERRRIELAPGAPLEAPPAPPAKPPEPVAKPAIVAPPRAIAAPEERRHWLFWTGIGVAGAGLLVGTVSGVVVLEKSGTLHDRCPDGCPPELQGDLDSARRWATVSSISFGVAAAGGVAAAIGYFLPKSPVTPVASVGFVGVLGRF